MTADELRKAVRLVQAQGYMVDFDLLLRAADELERLTTRVAELEAALQHQRHCAECAEGSWFDCDGGRASLKALGIGEDGLPIASEAK
jgi:hypothetical protein